VAIPTPSSLLPSRSSQLLSLGIVLWINLLSANEREREKTLRRCTALHSGIASNLTSYGGVGR
jgi:hypothetical protein